MGISGLLKEVSGLAKRKVHISDYAGKRAVVDASTWLYRGCYSCAREVALSKPTDKFLRFVMHRVKMLQYHKVKVTMVFDGRLLPLKEGTSKQRHGNKKAALSKAKQLEAQAKQCKQQSEKRRLWGEADKYYKQAYSPRFVHAAQLMRELRQEKIDFIVAPFEADAQLVYMCRIGHADLIVTEDSDLLVFSAAAGVSVPVLFKMSDDGCFDQVIRLGADMAERAGKLSGAASGCRPFLAKMRDFTERMFVQCCVLSGCDYSPGLSGVGLQKAQSLVLKFKDVPDDQRVEKILEHFFREKAKRDKRKAAKLSRQNSRASTPASAPSSQTSTSSSQDWSAPSTPRTPREEEAGTFEEKAAILARVELAFLHQSVFDPTTFTMARVLDLPSKVAAAGSESATSMTLWGRLAYDLAATAASTSTSTILRQKEIDPSTLDLNFLGPAYPQQEISRVARGTVSPKMVQICALGGASESSGDSNSISSEKTVPAMFAKAARSVSASHVKRKDSGAKVLRMTPVQQIRSVSILQETKHTKHEIRIGAELSDFVAAAKAAHAATEPHSQRQLSHREAHMTEKAPESKPHKRERETDAQRLAHDSTVASFGTPVAADGNARSKAARLQRGSTATVSPLRSAEKSFSAGLSNTTSTTSATRVVVDVDDCVVDLLGDGASFESSCTSVTETVTVESTTRGKPPATAMSVSAAFLSRKGRFKKGGMQATRVQSIKSFFSRR